MRTVLTLAAVVAAGLPAVADAAPPRKPLVCMQVVDAAGDAKVATQDAASLDVLSADLATGKKNLVAAIRTKATERESFLIGGRTMVWEWTVAGIRQRLTMTEYDSNERVGKLDLDTAAGMSGDEVVVPVVVDPNANMVTWTIARKVLPQLKKPGAKFSDFKVSANFGNNFKAIGTNGYTGTDTATGVKTYTDMTPTCLKGA